MYDKEASNKVTLTGINITKKFMKTFNEYLQESELTGTYSAVRFDQATNDNLKAFAESIGLKPIEDFHSTVVYSEKTLPDVKYQTNKAIKKVIPIEETKPGKIVGIKYLGDIDSEWRAVVLVIDCQAITLLHNYYVDDHGYKHHYPEFIQHISLAYSPPENLDLEKVTLPNFPINCINETVEPIKQT